MVFQLLLVIGLAFILSGIFITPVFVAKHITHVEILPDSTGSKVLKYQLFGVISGCILLLAAIRSLDRKYFKYAIIPILAIAFLLIHRVHINVLYPNNIFLDKSGLMKTWRLLLGEEIVVSDYQPRTELVVNNRKVKKARFPAVDFHFCLNSLKGINADELVRAMDACGVRAVVNVDGLPKEFKKFTREFKDKYPDRFIMFSSLKYWEVKNPGFPEEQLSELDNAVRMGAKGIKVYKNFGMDSLDRSGKLVSVDDPRFDPIWEKAGKLKLPVLMHAADPPAFWRTVDRYNERFEELNDNPKWGYARPGVPSRESILEHTENLVRKHPGTNFVLAHVGSNSHDLVYASKMMDKYPNYYVEIAAVLSELGRQPYTARKFFIKYQDRILFATDGGYGLDREGTWPPERLFRTYFEFLETENEYFEYQLWGIYSQGLWHIYGINLPDSVLEKIYYRNAMKLLNL